MHHSSSWRSRTHIGVGILFTIGLVALPGTHRRPPAPTFVPVALEELETQSWFGQASGLELPGISGEGVDWRPAGPLQFDESSDGRGRLTGYLVEGMNSSAIMRVDLQVSRRLSEEGFQRSGPGTFAEISGTLQGCGSLRGGLMRVETCREIALQCTENYGRLAMRAEWVELPNAAHLSEVPRKSLLHFDLQFSDETLWGAQGLSFELGGMQEPFELVAGGHLIEQSQGSAWLSAVIEQPGRPGNRFHLELNASRAGRAPLADPVGEAGKGFWRSYDRVTGTLRGMERLGGAVLNLSASDELFRVGGGGEGNALQEALGELVVQVVSESDLAHPFDERSRALLRVDLGLASAEYAFEAKSGQNSRESRNYAMDLGELGRDFVFRAGGLFTEHNDGSAHLSGELVRASDPESAYYLALRLRAPQVTHLFDESRRPLGAQAYSENSGPVDRSSWRGYSQLEGTLIGLRARNGEVMRLASTGEPVQLGLGANGRTLTYGAFADFVYKSDANGAGDFGHLSFDLRASSEEGLTLGLGDSWLAPLGLDLQLAAGGYLRQGTDGSAHVSAILARKAFPRQRMLLDLHLEGRAHGSNGAALAQASTHFSGLHGQLIGLEDLRGALVKIDSSSSAPSMGLGAGGDEARHGLSVPYRIRIVNQPEGDQRLGASTSHGVLAWDLSRKVSHQAQQAVALPSVRAPREHALYVPGIAEDLYFPGGGSFEESSDGSAVLRGHLVSALDPTIQFELLIQFDERRNTGKLSDSRRVFPASAYLAGGGAVDEDAWHSYGRARGILVGAGALAGSVLEITRDDLALEVGLGANRRNLEFGASGDFHLRLLSQPVGDWGSLPETYVWGELHLDLPRGPNSETTSGAQ